MVHIKDILDQDSLLKTIFESIPLGVMLVGSDHRVKALNNFMRQAFDVDNSQLIDSTIGKVIKCVTTDYGAGQCGQKEYCQRCQILNPALEALRGRRIQRNRAKVQLRIGEDTHDMEMLITAAPFQYNDEKYALVILEDITELSALRQQVHKEEKSVGLIGNDPSIIELRKKITSLAQVNVPVFIQGESGTGKELVARAIHLHGPRSKKSFVAINCGAIPDNLLESELFGHVKGAFTGALRDRKGRFELAHG